MTVYKAYEEIIDKSIAALGQRLVRQDILNMMPIMSFIREYKTLDLGLPRQVGKTTYIANHAKAGDLILVHNRLMAVHYEKEFGVMARSPGQMNYRMHRTEWLPYRIWVDEPRRHASDLFEVIYQYIKSPNQAIIMLGTS